MTRNDDIRAFARSLEKSLPENSLVLFLAAGIITPGDAPDTIKAGSTFVIPIPPDTPESRAAYETAATSVADLSEELFPLIVAKRGWK